MGKGGNITLLSDFGHQDAYVGMMKGVIMAINPDVKIVDLCHEITPQSVLEAGYMLYSSYRFFPPDTVHVVVVDPGVGTDRRIIGLRTTDYFFIAPDNGLLSFVCRYDRVEQIVEISNRRYFLKRVSDTFHGRDIFAPVAARLAQTRKLAPFGPSIAEIRLMDIPKPASPAPGVLHAEVIHIDRFGNAITNITRAIWRDFTAPTSGQTEASTKVKIQLGKHRISKLFRSYAEAEKKEPLAIFGSSDHLEISINLGNAQKELGIRRGQRVIAKI